MRQEIVDTIPMASSYAGICLAFSFIGFVAQQPTVHFHEYSFPEAVVEIGGHFVFGALAAFPLMGTRSALIGGSFAVVIDVDHLLGALNLNVSSRPDHSLVFAVVGSGLVWLISRRYFGAKNPRAALAAALAVPISALAHLSYDVLAAYTVFGGKGFSFPLLIPFNYTLIPFPFWSWTVFEFLALAVALSFRKSKWSKDRTGAWEPSSRRGRPGYQSRHIPRFHCRSLAAAPILELK